jgi:hypothetical protein
MQNKVFICLTAFSFFLYSSSLSQSARPDKKLNIWVGPQASVAAVDLAKTHSVGFGVHSKLAYKIAPKTELLGGVRYNHFLGKKKEGYSEPGGGSYGGGNYPGLNDVNITGGVRQNFTDNVYGDAEAGTCLGFSDGSSTAGLFFMAQLGYMFGTNSRYVQAVALFFGLCGDPKVQIGLSYSVRL